MAAVFDLRQRAAVARRAIRNLGSTAYTDLRADFDFGLGANDPIFLAIRFKPEVAVAGGQGIFAIGSADTMDNQRALRNGATYQSTAAYARLDSSTDGYSPDSGIFSIPTDQWYYAIAEFASATSRRVVLNGVPFAYDTTNITLTVPPTHLRLFASTLGVDANNGLARYAAVFAGTVSDRTMRQQAQGVHPLHWRERCLECWDFASPTPMRGLVRGTRMYPSFGTPLWGVDTGAFEGLRPTYRRFFDFGGGGGTRPYLLSTSGTQEYLGSGEPSTKQTSPADGYDFDDVSADVDVTTLFVEHYGLPWSEFLAGATPSPTHPWTLAMDDLADRAIAAGKPIALQLALTRDQVVANATDDGSGNLVITSNWSGSGYTFDSSYQTAYARACAWLVERFGASQINVGVEVSKYWSASGSGAGWTSVKAALNGAYAAVKAVDPTCIVYISVNAEDLYGGAATATTGWDEDLYDALAGIARDRFGLSTYPSGVTIAGTPVVPADLPSDYFRRVLDEHPDEVPVVIAETGWNCRPPHVNYDDVNCVDLTSDTQARQDAYLEFVLTRAAAGDVRLVTWWALRDLLPASVMSTCYVRAPGPGYTACSGDGWCIAINIFRDAFGSSFTGDLVYKGFGAMGLRDYDGTAHTALTRWQAAQALTYVSPTAWYSLIGSGGFTLAGAATIVRRAVRAATGGLALAGAATVARRRTVAPAGGLSLAGGATPIRRAVVLPSGGVTLGGAADVTRAAHVLPSGGLTLAGTADVRRLAALVASGGLVFDGAATITSSGLQSYSYTGSGGLTLAGTAAVLRRRTQAGDGSIAFAGHATIARVRQVLAAGGLTLSGEASVLRTATVTPSGGIVLTGAAVITSQSGISVIGSGGLTLSGAALVVRRLRVSADGGLTFAGGALIHTSADGVNIAAVLASGRIALMPGRDRALMPGRDRAVVPGGDV